jgi:hypothetical protein
VAVRQFVLPRKAKKEWRGGNMGIAHIPNNHHWNYFLMLDADSLELSRFIEFARPNYNTYSLELARLLMAAAAEVDVVAKLACAHLAPNARRWNIRDYHSVLSKGRPNLKNYPVRITRFGLKFKPWTSWSAKKSPKWWQACNDLKHHRDTEFRAASLKNTLNAVAGLFVMLIYAFPDEAKNGLLHPRPQLFSIPEAFVSGHGPVEYGTPIEYRL